MRLDNKIYLRELPAYQTISDTREKYLSKNCCYDLSLLPTRGLQNEMRDFILYRSEQVAITTLSGERTEYGQLCRFLIDKAHRIQSFRGREKKQWFRLLRIWMMEEGLPLVYENRCQYMKTYHHTSRLISYLKSVLEFYQPQCIRPEQEKDVWELDKLDIEFRHNPIKYSRTLDFTKVIQPVIRDELKKGIYLNLQSEAISCIRRELTAMRRLSAYLQERYPEVQTCGDLTRELIEEYLIHLNTEVSETKHFHSELNRLRAVLDSIGKIFDYPNLSALFLKRDIPPTPKAEFKTYSDAEMRRLNAALAELDEQSVRLMVIHQMLGTRISDTLTLAPDCLCEKNGETIIRIRQMKSRTYEKPISAELAALIRKAIAYTKERYGDTSYIFVSENNPRHAMQYNVLQTRVIKLIRKEDLRDDNGELFGFGSHMYRHYYCVKLAEMHLDDWTLAKLLGHASVRNVKYYRKMSSDVLADETRRVRNQLSEMILENLDGWENEYAKVRQNGGSK